MAAAVEQMGGMGDERVRPRLLRALLRDRLPDEKRASPTPAELSAVLAQIRTHGLLSECLHSPDPKLADAWRAAVDAWVARLIALIDSRMPDKCWAGVCLLGVTFEECNSERFLASYSLWFQKLLSNLQLPSSSHFVIVASCASLADLLTRLAGFSNVKKDAMSISRKLIQPILQLLNEGGSEAVWEGAVDLLCTLITFFPSSVHHHFDSIETVLVLKIMSGKCSENISKKFACCLALLPKAKGDEDCWSLMMQKILISINTLLTDAFQGLEDESRSSEAMKLLVPPGKDPPPPLGGHTLSREESEQVVKNLRDLLVPRMSALMQCCCLMLANPYPVQVVVPVRPLLSLIGRVLHVDGSLHQSSAHFTTTLHQELVCSALPTLHVNSLDLLNAIIKGVRSQLLPHAANIVRLLTEYFRGATLPSIRIKVYSIMQILLLSMGVGMALYLTQEVLDNAFADLDDHHSSGPVSSNAYSSEVTGDPSLQSSHRKRKHAPGVLQERPNRVELQVDMIGRKSVAPLSIKIAALRTLEALLTVGGSLRSECWRSKVDLLLITVAVNACDAGWANMGKCNILVEESTSSEAEFQVAALQALLASLLSPTHVRPPYLSQGLELFRRGKRETGTKVAAFCAHALLALEVLIHPRALPLVDMPVTKYSTFDEADHMLPGSMLYSGQKTNIASLSNHSLGAIDDLDNSELYRSWLGDDEETAVDGSNLDEPMENLEQTVQASIEVPLAEKHEAVKSVGSHEIVDGGPELPLSVDVEMACLDGEDNMAGLKNTEQLNSSTNLGVRSGNDVVPGKESSVLSSHSVFHKDVDASKSSTRGDFTAKEMDPGKRVEVLNITPTLDNVADNVPKSLVVTSEEKVRMLSHESDSDSMDSLPDIVDADPDSD